MRMTLRIWIVFVGLIVLCTAFGCKKQQAEDEYGTKPQEAQWEPESIDLPEGHSSDDGHDHSAHGHDHSGHNH